MNCSTAGITVLGVHVLGGLQTMLMDRLLCLLRGQDADVAGPHLACRTRTFRRRPPGLSCWPAILLKMGGYGFLRFSLPMFPVASEYAGAASCSGSRVIAIVYTSLVALVQVRHEEADRLFVGRPYGLRDHGHLCGQYSAGRAMARSSR